MNLFLPPLSAASIISPVPPSKVLSDWLRAISTFQNSFHQLNQYRLDTLNSDPGGTALGQGSSRQATQLLERMRQELILLSTELGCLSDLVSHTARLQLLSNQATIILSLLCQPKG